MTLKDIWNVSLLALCIWRESRGEPNEAKQAVAWTIKNRVLNARWWGNDWVSVILKPEQFSSFNPKDPNAVKFPLPGDVSWDSCMTIAHGVYSGQLPDNTKGSTHYFDKSMDNNPPSWAKELTPTLSINDLRLYRAA